MIKTLSNASILLAFVVATATASAHAQSDDALTPVDVGQSPTESTESTEPESTEPESTGLDSIELDSTEQDPIAPEEVSLSIEEQVMQRLGVMLPGIPFSDVTLSTIPGLYEVITDGQIYYVNEEAEYLIDGNLIRLSDRTNMTDARLGTIHMGLIEELDESMMLIYEPAEESDRSITVFTDISCGYCRLLHEEIDVLLEGGVRVRYLLFPRAGLGSQAHMDLESVWCADNPQEALTVAKAGGQIVPKTCDNPIEQHVELAERLGLRGTPLIYTDSGEKVPGYREASVLTTMVNQSEPFQ